MSSNTKSSLRFKLGIIPLVALILNSMIGSGVFGIPKTINAGAYPFATILAWTITGVGVFSIAKIYSVLAIKKAHLNSGPYRYAREGFGDFIGFVVAWGYWLAVLISNVTLLSLAFSGLGSFFEIFGDGTTVYSFIGKSVVIWVIFSLVKMGIKESGNYNIAVTLAKIVPILLFVILAAYSFDVNVFLKEFFDSVESSGSDVVKSEPSASLFLQIKGTMLATMWAFIGIEGANVFSSRAKIRTDIAKATIYAFIFSFTLYASISLLSAGIISHNTFSLLKEPSVAGVFEVIVGSSWGSYVINIGMIISVIGCFMAWLQYSAELPWIAASENLLHPIFLKLDNKETPSNSLLISTLLIQVFLFISYVTSSTYDILLELSTSGFLLPYLFSALYFFKIAQEEKYSLLNRMASVMAILYSLWLIYAAGLTYVILIITLYTTAVPMYGLTKKYYSDKSESFLSFFKPYERNIAIIMLGISVYGLYLVYTKYIIAS